MVLGSLCKAGVDFPLRWHACLTVADEIFSVFVDLRLPVGMSEKGMKRFLFGSKLVLKVSKTQKANSVFVWYKTRSQNQIIVFVLKFSAIPTDYNNVVDVDWAEIFTEDSPITGILRISCVARFVQSLLCSTRKSTSYSTIFTIIASFIIFKP